MAKLSADEALKKWALNYVYESHTKHRSDYELTVKSVVWYPKEEIYCPTCGPEPAHFWVSYNCSKCVGGRGASIYKSDIIEVIKEVVEVGNA